MVAVDYLAEREQLRRLGAEHVVALAPEAVLGFALSILGSLGVPANEADAIVDALQVDDYAALRRVGAVELKQTDHRNPRASEQAERWFDPRRFQSAMRRLVAKSKVDETSAS